MVGCTGREWRGTPEADRTMVCTKGRGTTLVLLFQSTTARDDKAEMVHVDKDLSLSDNVGGSN